MGKIQKCKMCVNPARADGWIKAWGSGVLGMGSIDEEDE